MSQQRDARGGTLAPGADNATAHRQYDAESGTTHTPHDSGSEHEHEKKQDRKTAVNGPGPAEPYSAMVDGKPIVLDDEMRIAGVKRIEATSAQLGPVARGLMFFGCFLLAYGYGLDGQIRYTYQGYATGEFGIHSLLTTINVVRSVIGAAAQPAAGKVADVFGRLELLLFSIFLYVIGTIVEAASNSLESFCAGAVLYELGYTMALLLVEVIIGDLSSLRSRVFYSFVPAMPFLINAWISPLVLEAGVGPLGDRTWFWRWGIGMWAAIYPAASLLLVGVLIYAQIKAKRAGALADYRSPFVVQGYPRFRSLIVHFQVRDLLRKLGATITGPIAKLFWQLDVIGILLIIVALGFFLTPFTLAGGYLSPTEGWSQAKVIAPLVIGVAFFPVLFFWEKLCKYPMIPFKLLRDRGIWAGLLIAMFVNAAWYMQFTFGYAVLIIAFNQTPRNTAFIQNTYSFTSTVIGITTGLVVVRFRRLKPFIVAGVCIFMIGFGLLVRFRGNADGGELAGYIAAEILLGIGAGMFTYPTQAAVQAQTKHERMAVVTGLYLASFRVGNAIGSAISGAVWTQRMLPTLTSQIGNATIAANFYGNPYATVLQYPYGTPERTGAIEAYREVQRILAIIGLCLCVPLILFALLLRDPKLGKEQSLANAEMNDEEKAGQQRAYKWYSWKRWA